MNISRIQLILPVLGLAAFTALSAPTFAQEEKGTESTQGVEKGEVEGSAEKIVQKGEKKGSKADHKKSELPGNKGKARKKKTTPEERELLKAVSKEMGEYRTQKARLRQAHEIAKKNGNEEQIARVKELRPKVEARHKGVMDGLNEKYGKEHVDSAVAYFEAKSKGNRKSSEKIRAGGKKKGGQYSEKGKKKGKDRGGNGDGSSDS